MAVGYAKALPSIFSKSSLLPTCPSLLSHTKSDAGQYNCRAYIPVVEFSWATSFLPSVRGPTLTSSIDTIATRLLSGIETTVFGVPNPGE